MGGFKHVSLRTYTEARKNRGNLEEDGVSLKQHIRDQTEEEGGRRK